MVNNARTLSARLKPAGVLSAQLKSVIHTGGTGMNVERGDSATQASKPNKHELFFTLPVRNLLYTLAGMDYDRVFKITRRGQKIRAPTYLFLSEQELLDARLKARKRAKWRLQMPPIMNERPRSPEILETDPGIAGYDSAKLVFTDITYGIHDRDRIIAVREPNGTLREAAGLERDRLNQIYFPHIDRKVNPPSMFQPENLANILRPDRYLYILDRNCIQFEPDHPTYIDTAKTVYDHVDSKLEYDILWSTRHYGPMVFHLVWVQKCDDLIGNPIRLAVT